MANKLERSVIDCARLVHLGWMGDGVDGGAAMRVAMKKLGMAFTSLDESPPATEFDWTELVSLRAERDRLATDLGIRSEILEEVANGTTPATRTSIQARHEQLWAEIAKK